MVDVSADSDAESAKRKMQVKIVFQGAATPPSKLEIEEGTTNIKQFRRSVFGLRDAGEKITFRVGHVTLEIDQGGGLGTLFDLADKEAEVSGQSEVVANVYVAAPNGEGGIGAHGGVHFSAGGVAGGAVGGRGGGAANRLGGGGVVGGGGGGGHGPVNGIVGGPGQGNRIRVFGKFPPGTPLVPGGLLGRRSLSELKDQIYQALLSGELSVEYFQDRAGYVGADGTIMLGKGGIVNAWSAPALLAKLHSLILFVEAARSNPSVRPQ